VVYAFKVSQNAFIRAASTVYPRIEFLCVQVYCIRVLDCRYRSLFEGKNQRRLRGQAHTTSRDEIQPAEQISGAHCWLGGGGRATTGRLGAGGPMLPGAMGGGEGATSVGVGGWWEKVKARIKLLTGLRIRVTG